MRIAFALKNVRDYDEAILELWGALQELVRRGSPRVVGIRQYSVLSYSILRKERVSRRREIIDVDFVHLRKVGNHLLNRCTEGGKLIVVELYLGQIGCDAELG